MRVDPDAVLDAGTIASLRELSSADDDLLAEVARIFARDAAKWLTVIRDAADRSDADAMWKAAHELRSLASNAGALRVASLCDTVQERGLSRELSDAEELAAMTVREVDRACAALRQVTSEG